MTLTHSRHNPKIRLLPDELLEISQEISQEFAPNSNTRAPSPDNQVNLSADEMLAISEEIRLRFTPKASDNNKEVVLLPVDPGHLYAYWNLGDDKLNTLQHHDAGNQLTLRIYSESKGQTETTITRPWFEIAIDRTQAQQKISLPSPTHATAYSATIGKRNPANDQASFASSHITRLAFGKTEPDQFKEQQIVSEPQPQPVTPGMETAACTKNSASGQGTKL